MKRLRRCLVPGWFLLFAAPVMAAEDSVMLYAAGSLRAAMTEIAAAFVEQGGSSVKAEFGPSGLLRERIAEGEPADVFASANMEHPRALAASGTAVAPVLFARNRLCALVRHGGAVTTGNLLERMLDPGIKLATSTPKYDPSGDYAWAAFAKAERVRPGSFRQLAAKALQLVGGPDSPPPRPGRSPYGTSLDEGRADIFLTYCTNAALAVRESPALRTVHLPEALGVGADYGLTVLTNARPVSFRFALFVMSQPGQAILERYGFAGVR